MKWSWWCNIHGIQLSEAMGFQPLQARNTTRSESPRSHLQILLYIIQQLTSSYDKKDDAKLPLRLIYIIIFLKKGLRHWISIKLGIISFHSTSERYPIMTSSEPSKYLFLIRLGASNTNNTISTAKGDSLPRLLLCHHMHRSSFQTRWTKFHQAFRTVPLCHAIWTKATFSSLRKTRYYYYQTKLRLFFTWGY